MVNTHYFWYFTLAFYLVMMSEALNSRSIFCLRMKLCTVQSKYERLTKYLYKCSIIIKKNGN